MKIITLTLSPAIDIEYHTQSVNTDGLNRTYSHTVTAGGKGINVSRIIENLLRRRIMLPVFVELKTVAPVGGETGRMFAGILEKEYLPLTAVEIEENTRTNVSLIGDDGREIEINAPGTPVGDKIGQVEEALLGDLCENDVVIIAGSCPSDVPKSYPAELCAKVKAKGAVCVIDCDGEALKLAVSADVTPDLIKPNHKELSALVGRELVSKQDIAQAAEELKVPVVITTMAGDGSIITREVNEYRTSTFVPTEKRRVVRLKGAGDTFLGAFVYAKYAAQMNDIEAMNFAGDIAGHYVAGE